MGKKRKGGNPRNRSGSGRITKPEPSCRSRSVHERRKVGHLFSSYRTVNDVRENHCSWCGTIAPGSPRIPAARGPEPADEVPDDWFSDAEPVCALPIEEWQRVHGKPGEWPQASQEALLSALS